MVENKCWHCRIIMMANQRVNSGNKLLKTTEICYFIVMKFTLSFKKYVTKMKQPFNVLENYIVPLYEEDTVRQILDNINCPNNNMKTEINVCISIHSDSFDIDSTYLSTVISPLFPANQISSGSYGRRRQVRSSRRGG